jgi:hypothetical protein
MPSPGDGQVEGYDRVVNGKVIKVNAYAKRSTTATRAAAAVRRLPGRPRIAAQPGSYTSGRDIPGVRAKSLPPEPPQVPFQKGKKNEPGQR